MKRVIIIAVSLLFVWSASFAAVGSRRTVGTPASILNGLMKEKIAASSVYNFTTSSGQQIPVIVDFFNFEKGELSMSGKAEESDNSGFILKGSEKEMYGWIYLKDKKLAYEYTTNEYGDVVAEEVPLSKVFVEDDFVGEGMSEATAKAAHDEYAAFVGKHRAPFPPHIGTYPGGSVIKLQSMPGAPKVIYIDCKSIMNGEEPIGMKKEELFQAWQGVAAGFSVWKVNTTTDPEVAAAAGQANVGRARMNNSTGGTSSSPVAAFGTSQCSSVNKYSQGGYGYGTGRICWHELGHLCGVYDMGGNPGGTYFTGFPQYKWTPVMGNVWPGDKWGAEALYQYSKGEFTSATSKVDLFVKFMQVCKFEYKPDDIAQTKPLTLTGTTVKVENNFGQIGPTGDSDGWTFKIGSTRGHAKLKINRIEYYAGAQLDVEASILDASGKELAKNNPEAARYAELDLDLPAGDYTLMIKGGAEGTPQKGFSNYSSIGYYGIEGEIAGGVTSIAPIEQLKSSIHLSPINTRGVMKLECPDNVTGISVYNAKGMRVFHSETKVNIIDLSGVAAGMYMLNIAVDGTALVQKIIKN